MSELRTDSTERRPSMVPQNAIWTQRMKDLVAEIEYAHSQQNWYVVEIKAQELAIMCEMRRTK